MQVGPGCEGEVLELGLEADVPVYVVFEDQGRGEVLLDDAGACELTVTRDGAVDESHVRKAFMCARHDPLLPLLMFLSRLSGGRISSNTWSPATPSIQSNFMPVRAPAKAMASRLSDLDGRLMTKTF